MKNTFDNMEDGQGPGELVKAIYQKTSTLPSTHQLINQLTNQSKYGKTCLQAQNILKNNSERINSVPLGTQ